MYYKILNQESEVYQKLQSLLIEEDAMQKRNEDAVNEKVKLKYSQVLGVSRTRSVYRVQQFEGFNFYDDSKIDPKIWVEFKSHPGIYVPNRRTKLGREMAEFLRNIEHSWMDKVFEIALNREIFIVDGSYRIPICVQRDEVIYLGLDDQFNVENPDIIEITKTEFFTKVNAENCVQRRG